MLENPDTRDKAGVLIEGLFQQALNGGKRLFSGFDFAFGYPGGAARVMTGVASWQNVWSLLTEEVTDREDNQSNRFEVGGRLNTAFRDHLDETPFWGHPHQHAGRYPGLQPKKPAYASVTEKRIVEECLGSAQPVWKLAYNGSVGSQTLLGIPRLERLRQSFADRLSIWPFESRFADNLMAPITVAEIYPSLLTNAAAQGEVKDATQVRVMAETFCALDGENRFAKLLSSPDDLSAKDRNLVLAEEGWIVGAGTYST